MADEVDPLRRVVPLVSALEAKGLEPVLVGGMALVVLGSQRVTRDFDFLVSSRNLEPDIVEAIYRHGYELVTKLNPAGEVARTIDSATVAAARLKLDKPQSVFFFDRHTGLRIDLLLDFPLPGRDIAGRASKIGTTTGTLRVASPEDLLRLKEIAYADRKSATDAHDLEFLRRMLKSRP
jgi:hypothetical protein